MAASFQLARPVHCEATGKPREAPAEPGTKLGAVRAPWQVSRVLAICSRLALSRISCSHAVMLGFITYYQGRWRSGVAGGLVGRWRGGCDDVDCGRYDWILQVV